MTTNERYARAETAAWMSLLGNVGIAAIKMGVGMMGSKALLADACRSASDASAAFVSLTALRRRRQFGANDAPVPMTKGRVESVTGVMISMMLMIMGLEVGISAIKSIADGIDEGPGWSAVTTVLIAFLIKEIFFPVKERRTDLYATLAALVGTGTAALGEPLNLPILYYFDPASSIVIVVVVLTNGYRVATASVLKRSYCEEQPADINEFKAAVQRIEGVVTVEELRAREHGHYVITDVVITVNPRITVMEGNEIAKRVKYFLMKRFSHVTDVTVHVQPYDPGYPYKTNHDPNQEQQLPTLLQ
ncbi:cation diffusion facilitator family transporter [Paenibacillus phyllosphaerae]|uniref:Cation diffusion facilitator family transporter n=1 Tax=Paenibacillus phyllosphaerae TaxID=274593 RepID=A0A7W5FMF5_9BACL|nr:cation diffusion facilitator family transporter [Paenibacillus phyllosphaerae]MBB3109934.1 cation diffusion facilitator family transporter [Paenibacillus phyllosphaerae]